MLKTTFFPRSFLSISALLLVATLFCACNKDPRYVLTAEYSPTISGLNARGKAISRLLITDRKGNKKDITPTLPDGLRLDEARFAASNPRLIILSTSLPNSSSSVYITFSMDLDGKNLRRLENGATDAR